MVHIVQFPIPGSEQCQGFMEWWGGRRGGRRENTLIMQLIPFSNHKVASVSLSAGGFGQTSGEGHVLEKVQINISG